MKLQLGKSASVKTYQTNGNSAEFYTIMLGQPVIYIEGFCL